MPIVWIIVGLLVLFALLLLTKAIKIVPGVPAPRRVPPRTLACHTRTGPRGPDPVHRPRRDRRPP